jgi:D-glycerate 3-kinase
MTPQEQLIADHVRSWHRPGTMLVVGICGPQASGKSTACANVANQLRSEGLRVAEMSLDDLYLSRSDRQQLADTVHPLLITRGPPGTHDVVLGEQVVAALRAGHSVALPRFSKEHDEPHPAQDWPVFEGPCDVLLFEGWCVGAAPLDVGTLADPVNALERDEDPDGVWRRWWNDQLAGATGALFSQIDRLIQLRPPSFDVVFRWRCEQEHKMLARVGAENAPGSMSDAQIARFIAHYERMTNHILTEMPGRADLVIHLDANRGVTGHQVKR